MTNPVPSEARVEQPGDPGAQVEIAPVRSSHDLKLFIELPLELYRGDPNFVPPLLMERRDFLDPKKNPFFRHATHQLFLARQSGKVVGRIAAVDDRNFNEFHDTNYAWFGLYEAVDDDRVARALFEAARDWARARGRARLLGPANLSSNHEIGLLIDGFDQPPSIQTPYNPRYYIRHLEEVFGLEKEKDLFAWWLDTDVEPNPKVARIQEKIRKKEGVVVRPVRLDDFAAEARRIKTIYNEAWEKNWGFVPFTDEEFDHVAKDMRNIVDADFLLIAEIEGEPVAFAMTLPDLNQALIHVGGRLTTFGIPIGLAKLLWYSRKIDRMRLITLGIKEKYRKRGIDSILYHELFTKARERGIVGADISWTLEDNFLVNRAIEAMGGERTRTFRVYGADL